MVLKKLEIRQFKKWFLRQTNEETCKKNNYIILILDNYRKIRIPLIPRLTQVFSHTCDKLQSPSQGLCFHTYSK